MPMILYTALKLEEELNDQHKENGSLHYDNFVMEKYVVLEKELGKNIMGKYMIRWLKTNRIVWALFLGL